MSIMKKAVELMEEGVEVALVTITKAQGSTPRDVGAQMLVLRDGSIEGTIGGGILENRVIELAIQSIMKGESKSISISLEADLGMVCGGEIEAFFQVYNPRPKLLIIGGGHVSLSLYKMASLLDFDIIIFEDREEFLNQERFPLSKELVLGTIDENLRNYHIDENCYIVIVTRGHKHDEVALRSIVDSKAKYIGVMGSKRKVINMFNNLKEKGVDEKRLDKIYSPIGLHIDDGTPEEIAIGILAEILSIKNGKAIEHMKLNNNI